MKKILQTLALAGSLVLGGCGDSKPAIWTEKDIKSKATFIRIPDKDSPGSTFRESRLVDFDNDDIVDAVEGLDRFELFFVAKGYEETARKECNIDSKTKVMTPEMRDAVTKIYQGDKEFTREFLKSRGAYKGD